jgi:hypothetical protein
LALRTSAQYELVWSTDYTERRTRIARLRYLLAHLDVPLDDLKRLEVAFAAVEKERQQVEMAVESGDIDREDAGLSVQLIEDVVSAADNIAYGLHRRRLCWGR